MPFGDRTGGAVCPGACLLYTSRCKTDVLIIGGGTAGCYAALTIAEQSDAKVLICEKAHIKRSGCLAAGVNALNAYITEGRKPQDYVDYARKDADCLLYTSRCV